MCHLASANVIAKAFRFVVDLWMYLCLGEIEYKAFVYVHHCQEALWYVYAIHKTVGAYSRGCTVPKPERSFWLDRRYAFCLIQAVKMTSCPIIYLPCQLLLAPGHN